MTNLSNNYGLKKALYTFLAVIIVFGALYSGVLFFSTVRALVARTSLPFSESVVRAHTVEGSPPGQELPDIVEKKERVNILLLGIDQRENDPGPWRTDTVIVMSIDPATNAASMLSIPRDLWVTVPGFGENRINMAHFLGDARDYPGGGPALAKRTVWQVLGIPIHYYVRVNFAGFEEMVDAMGGITLDVKKPIHDDKYPDGHYGTLTIDIPAGIRHMDGQIALQYARSRHGTGDFDRMARQQAVLLAVRDRALSLDIPLSRIPKLMDLAGNSIQTDLPLDEILALAEIAKRVNRSSIEHAVIDDSMTTTVVTPQKAMVEVADWDKVRKLVDDLFPAPVPSVAPTPSLVKAQLSTEGGRIALQNGTLVTGLAQRTAQHLREKGFNVVRYDNADRFDHGQTIIINYADKRYTVDALAAQLKVKPENIRHEKGATSDFDILIILGRDYAQWVSQE